MMLASVLLATMLADEPEAPVSTTEAPQTPSLEQPAPATMTSVDRNKEESSHHFASRVGVGGSLIWIADIPTHGFDALAALGGMSKHVGWSIEGAMFAGETPNHLAVSRYGVGPNLDLRFGPLGLGLGLSVVSTSIQRTSSMETLHFLSTSYVGRVTVDCYSWSQGRHALYAGARLSYSGANGATVGGVGLMLGYRFRD